MREIKFRAYHKYMKKMLMPVKLHLNDGKMTCFETLLDDNVYQVKIDDKEYGLHIMQYTGIKDKNGKEIYEGDILQYKENRNYGKVEFIEGCFKILRNFSDPHKETFIVGGYHEVIGNIYEDKHLLTN